VGLAPLSCTDDRVKERGETGDDSAGQEMHGAEQCDVKAQLQRVIPKKSSHENITLP
jgi:hypothetical protein